MRARRATRSGCWRRVRPVGGVDREDESMSSLLPNLDDLLEALPDSVANVEARELAFAAAGAESLEELDAVLSAVVRGWLA